MKPKKCIGCDYKDCKFNAHKGHSLISAIGNLDQTIFKHEVLNKLAKASRRKVAQEPSGIKVWTGFEIGIKYYEGMEGMKFIAVEDLQKKGERNKYGVWEIYLDLDKVKP